MRLALFDCDGTLVDSQHVIMTAMERTFAAENLAWPGREATLAIIGLSLTEAFAVLVPQHEAIHSSRIGLALLIVALLAGVLAWVVQHAPPPPDFSLF